MKPFSKHFKDELVYVAFMMVKLEDFTAEHEKYGDTNLVKISRAAANMTKGLLNKLQSFATQDDLDMLASKTRNQTMCIVYNDQAGQMTKDFHKLFRVNTDDLEVLTGHAVAGSCTNCKQTGTQAKLCDLRAALNRIELEGYNDRAACPYIGMMSQKVGE
jgi:hypothetical protein